MENKIFSVLASDSKTEARAGVITTDHGQIETPIFMPVGTQATVKTLNQEQIKRDVKAQIILGNTYHLYLRPGTDVLQKGEGLHKFMNWDGPILTDSGGYQVYSLSGMRKIKEEGVKFASHIDGSKHLFTPERAIDIQREIGADIIMAFDECTPYPCDKKYAERSMHLTHRWLKRCIDHFDGEDNKPLYGHNQILAPIIQGSVYSDLRKKSAEKIASYEREINAIGGLSVGEPKEDLYRMTEEVCDVLPKHTPRYLMGVGTPENILECISLGIDMFDCVLPSRNARHGMLYTSEGIINIKNAKWKEDFSFIDSAGYCHTSTIHTKAYLRHLFVVKESLGLQLATLQNLSFYLWLVKEARIKILDGSFASWKETMMPKISKRL